ncbi:MAG: aminotransferase class III-fold pyridoxal phosphate-dependent enzyme [Steroidobacteraceae bacterium]
MRSSSTSPTPKVFPRARARPFRLGIDGPAPGESLLTGPEGARTTRASCCTRWRIRARCRNSPRSSWPAATASGSPDVDGHRVVDGVGGLWNINLGYGREEIKRAIVDQLDELAFYSCFRGTTHPRAIELSVRLVGMLQPEGMARRLLQRRLRRGGGRAEDRAPVLEVDGPGRPPQSSSRSSRAGHGVHFGGMSVNGNTAFRRAYEPLLPGCFHIDTPWDYRNPYTDDPQRRPARSGAELLDREIRFQGPDTVAAFIAEPVQAPAA